jgi:DNA-binding transcriptional regulator YiaG
MTPLEVQELRGKLKLNQQELAGKLGVSVWAVRSWEQGWRHPGGAACTLMKMLIPQSLPDAKDGTGPAA